MSVRVKICGITSVEDALAAVEAGADALGLVFYAPSPRAVGIEQACEICLALPPFVTTVGLFVNENTNIIHDVIDRVPLQLLQFHGDETEQDCALFKRPYIKAIAMRPDIDLYEMAERYGSASGLLLDTYRDDNAGGTGETFDWKRVPPDLKLPIILAGGLNPDNVQQATAQVSPYAVDVSSGVESSKGIKDADTMAAFVRAAKQE